MSEAAVQELENMDLLQSQAVIQWRAGEGEDYPLEGTLETIVFCDFMEHGLTVPVSEFFHALLGNPIASSDPTILLASFCIHPFLRSIPWNSSPLPSFPTFFYPCTYSECCQTRRRRGCELVLRPETQDEYLSYDSASKGIEWKRFWFYVGNFESPLPERIAGAPQVQTSWSSRGPGGKQVECILGAIAKFKNKGVTGDHVVFSFVSRRVQPLQRRKHPAFRYEGTKDPTRLSLEAMAHSEVVRRCCKVLDNFDRSLVLPTHFSAVNPPEKTWVSVKNTIEYS
jgi:hypothetical protein